VGNASPSVFLDRHTASNRPINNQQDDGAVRRPMRLPPKPGADTMVIGRYTLKRDLLTAKRSPPTAEQFYGPLTMVLKR